MRPRVGIIPDVEIPRVFRDAERTPVEEMICQERIRANGVVPLCQTERHTHVSDIKAIGPPAQGRFFFAPAVRSRPLERLTRCALSIELAPELVQEGPQIGNIFRKDLSPFL